MLARKYKNYNYEIMRIDIQFLKAKKPNHYQTDKF